MKTPPPKQLPIPVLFAPSEHGCFFSSLIFASTKSCPSGVAQCDGKKISSTSTSTSLLGKMLSFSKHARFWLIPLPNMISEVGYLRIASPPGKESNYPLATRQLRSGRPGWHPEIRIRKWRSEEGTGFKSGKRYRTLPFLERNSIHHISFHDSLTVELSHHQNIRCQKCASLVGTGTATRDCCQTFPLR